MPSWIPILAALLLSWTTGAQPPAEPPATRAAILTFGEEDADHVGVHITADTFRACIPLLKEEKIDTVVVRFHSGGGFYSEVEKFSDLFHHEFKKEFRLVAWVDEALSAAAMSAHSIEKICFTPQGTYGAATGFSGALDERASWWARQDEVRLGELISARGWHHPQIMRAMQISSEPDECGPLFQPPFGTLSADIDAATGEVRFRTDASGAIKLNPRGGIHILTFNAEEALKVRFSKGTAETLQELSGVLGLARVEWVGEPGEDPRWPVCKAERSLIEHRRKTARAFAELKELVEALNAGITKTWAAPWHELDGQIADLRGTLERLKAVAAANPSLVQLQWGREEFYQQRLTETGLMIARLEHDMAVQRRASEPRETRAHRAAVLSFGDEEYGDMVGIYETAESFRACIPLLEEEKVDTIVIRVKSGGGLWAEVPRLADLFHTEFKPRFRTVAWIDTAISAGCMSVHSLEEIYFTPKGVYGGCSGGAHRGPGWQPPRRDEELRIMDCISAMGDHHRQIMRAMMRPSKEFADAYGGKPPYGDLSATVDAASGEVRFFEDTSGAIVLNPHGGLHCLTLDAEAARSVRFSRGTAATLDELAKAMNLPKVEWVGDKDPASPWPVCKAERHLQAFRKDARAGETEFGRAFRAVRLELDDAKPVPDSKRAARRDALNRSLKTIRDRIASNENWMLLMWPDADEYACWIAEARHRLADLSADPRPDAEALPR